MADPSHPITSTFTSASFSFLTSHQISKISVKQVTNPILFDNLSNPTKSGLYDPAFGPLEGGDICQTCRQTSFSCPGHFGHILLPAPVYHPLFLNQCYALFRGCCTHCHRFLASSHVVLCTLAKLVLLEHGLPLAAAQVDALAGSMLSTAKKRRKGAGRKRKADAVDDRGEGVNDGEDDDDDPDSLAQVRAKLTIWVKSALKRKEIEERDLAKSNGVNGSKSRGRDGFKYAGPMVGEERRKTIAEFLKIISKKKCANCHAFARRLKKDGPSKIMEYSLTWKQQASHEARNIKRKSLTVLHALASKAAAEAEGQNEEQEIQKKRFQNGHSSTPTPARKKRRMSGGAKLVGRDDDEEDEGFYEDEDRSDDSDSDSKDEERSTSEEEEDEDDEDRMDIDNSPAAKTSNQKGKGKQSKSKSKTPTTPTIAAPKSKSSKSQRFKQTERVILPDEVRSHLRLLFANEPEICSLLYSPHGPLFSSSSSSTTTSSSSSHPSSLINPLNLAGPRLKSSPDMFFMSSIPVPPSRYRPASKVKDQTFENPQTALLGGILKATLRVKDLNEIWTGPDRIVAGAGKNKDGDGGQTPGSNKKRGGKNKGGKKGKEGNGGDVEEAEVEMTLVDKNKIYEQLLQALLELQVAVNSMVDTTKNPMPTRQGTLPPQGVKQLLEKKEGLFRMNMMGKRVNYAARSVISPDVNIETNEIGVPPIFARKLTFPEPVTEHNFHRLRQLVINGPNKHPGASFIQNQDGQLISLEGMTVEQRIGLANGLLLVESTVAGGHSSTTTTSSGGSSVGGGGRRPDVGLPKTKIPQVGKKVLRHLDDGDIVILNRQPTLHKPSMMCHKAKILTGEKTIRMHYANCNSYNADFDGDEMNMHFPQSVLAHAEAHHIANTDNQYLVPTAGGPIRGLIQDHVVAGVWMTNKQAFFTRSEYQQLVYGALRPEDGYTGGGMIHTVPPAICKPTWLWTGKQILTTVLINITPETCAGLNMSSKTKVTKQWGVFTDEEQFEVFDGEHISGILDKAQFGGGGLVHAVYEVYGPTTAGKLLSILSRLFTKFLQHRGFSCGIEDLVLTPDAERNRKQTLAQADKRSLDALYGYVGLDKADRNAPETKKSMRARLQEVVRDERKAIGLDAITSAQMGKLWSESNDRCMGAGLFRPFPLNCMQTMTLSGAKGSLVNASMISSALGQQSLEGRRVPVMTSGKTLPSFRAFETRPRAGGFIASRFLTGIPAQEYYFHCMAGREGLIDTAVKTSRSGYLQRCLIKHLEGVRVHYDHTVRNSDYSVLQFNYGEDSLDVTKQKSIFDFDFVARNYASLVQRCRPKDLAGRFDEREAHEHAKALLKAAKRPKELAKLTTTLSQFSPTQHLGSTSEKYFAESERYIKGNPSHLLKPKKKHQNEVAPYLRLENMISTKTFRSMLDVRYLKSLVEAGEAVGLLASQSVGEPSTQMTLNTFHLSGFGDANVTLGIPRLREIVMTASQNIKTPTMRLPVPQSMQDDLPALQRLCASLSRLNLSEALDHITVTERLSGKDKETGNPRQRIYVLRLHFFDAAACAQQLSVEFEQLMNAIQTSFAPLLEREIKKELRLRARETKAQTSDIGQGHRAAAATEATENAGEGGDDAEPQAKKSQVNPEAEDGDADDAKRAANSKQIATYDSDEEPEDDEDEEQIVNTDKDSGVEDADFAESEDKPEGSSANFQPPRQLHERLVALEQEIVACSKDKYISQVNIDKVGYRWCDLTLEFDSHTPKLLLVGIAEECCRKAVVRETPGISRCLVIEPKNESETRHLLTEGCNFRAIWDMAELINVDRISSNDIGAFLHTYGVEAARANIIVEMRAIFNAYKIDVDYRHLSIIADYMTCEGAFKAFNRTGLASSSSPFLKASFETTAAFLSDSVLYGDFDDLAGPSANIVMGKLSKGGTGVFDILAEI